MITMRGIRTDEQSGARISKKGKLRAFLDEAEAIAAGFSLEPPIYALGTVVNETGVENFKRSRLEFVAMPEHPAEKLTLVW